MFHYCFCVWHCLSTILASINFWLDCHFLSFTIIHFYLWFYFTYAIFLSALFRKLSSFLSTLGFYYYSLSILLCITFSMHFTIAVVIFSLLCHFNRLGIFQNIRSLKTTVFLRLFVPVAQWAWSLSFLCLSESAILFWIIFLAAQLLSL